MEPKYCKKPCNQCPFLKTSTEGWLGGFSPELTYIGAVGEDDFICHKTREDDKEKKLCAGRLLFASKLFRRKELDDLVEIVVKKNPGYKNKILGAKEFLEHHKNYM